MPGAAGFVRLEVEAVSASPTRYQWYREGRLLPGQTEAHLEVAGLGTCIVGAYQAWVENDLGGSFSEPAVVTVRPPGAVIGLGRNDEGQSAAPEEADDLIALQAGYYHSLGLRADGTVVAWGGDFDGQATVPNGLTGVIAIAAGYFHNVAVRGNGTVVAWGANVNGLVTAVPAGLQQVVAVAAGQWHTLALRQDGSIVAWGYSTGYPIAPSEILRARAVAVGANHSLALRLDGRVEAWGLDYAGLLRVPAEAVGVIAIAAGGHHNLALRADGRVIAWGDNSAGQTDVPADLDAVVAIAAGYRHSLALRADGTVAVWGDNASQQAQAPAGLTGVALIAGGKDHSLLFTRSPRLLGQSCSRTVVEGTDVVLRVEAEGPAPLLYEWTRDGQLLPGATGPELLLATVNAQTAGRYQASIANPHGITRSAPIDLEVVPSLLTIVTQPASLEVLAGQPVLLSVAAVGMGDLTYEWFRDGLRLETVQGAELRLEPATAGDAGVYTVRVRDARTTAWSAAAALTVKELPAVRLFPPALQVSPGGVVRLWAVTVGTGPFQFEWRQDGIAVADQDGAELLLEGVSSAEAGVYQVVVVTPFGSATSEAVLVGIEETDLPAALDLPEANWLAGPGRTRSSSCPARSTGSWRHRPMSRRIWVNRPGSGSRPPSNGLLNWPISGCATGSRSRHTSPDTRSRRSDGRTLANMRSG
jgi:hypothetical protein